MNSDAITEILNKLELVETRQAFQEDTIESLNKEIINQQTDLQNLELKIKILEERINEAATTAETQQEEPLPPHY